MKMKGVKPFKKIINTRIFKAARKSGCIKPWWCFSNTFYDAQTSLKLKGKHSLFWNQFIGIVFAVNCQAEYLVQLRWKIKYYFTKFEIYLINFQGFFLVIETGLYIPTSHILVYLNTVSLILSGLFYYTIELSVWFLNFSTKSLEDFFPFF